MAIASLARFAVVLRDEDNIAVILKSPTPDVEIEYQGETFTIKQSIAPGHKIALRRIANGEPVLKYGQVIGFAACEIAAGEHVHEHNLTVKEFAKDYGYCRDAKIPEFDTEPRYFMGFDRGANKYGTRNYIAIVSTVNCSASTSKYVAEEIRRRGILDDFPNIDGIIPITHKAGCAMQYNSEDHNQLDRTLAGFAKHANVSNFLLIGLGCETGTAMHLIENQGLLQINTGRSMDNVLSIQDHGGIGKTVEEGVQRILRMLPAANDIQRKKIPVSELILGTQCGGSDGYSGVTANPAVGLAVDRLVRQNGTGVLAETSEIYGAEHLLTRRAISQAVGEKLLERIRWWEWYTGIFGAEINNNPSPGNKAGGLSTIYEKSLGAIAKGGSTALRAVYKYAEPITAKGFVIMDTPGYDPVSMTGLVAGGANVLVFTTGRGSVFGCKPVPSIKIATNSRMFNHMQDDMDINAGVILDGVPIEVVAEQIFEEIIAVASGKKTKSELTGVGEEEFAPWAIGPTL